MKETYYKYMMLSLRVIMLVILCLFPCVDIMRTRLESSLDMDSKAEPVILSKEGDTIEFYAFIPDISLFRSYGIKLDAELSENSLADLEISWGGTTGK